MALLTKDQINDLVGMIIEEFGSSLNEDQLNESAYSLLEDISGFEITPIQEVDHVMNQIRSTYNDRCSTDKNETSRKESKPS